MKKLMLIVAAFVLSFNIMAQDISREEWRNMSRKERKEYKAQVAAKQKQELMQVLTARAWVLEATQIQNRHGETEIIESSLNFVGVAGENASVQLGSSGDIGFNGVGGITVEGQVRKYEVVETKAGATVRIEIAGASSGFLSITLMVNASGHATATVNDINGDKLTYRGQFVPLGESTVYQGTINYL